MPYIIMKRSDVPAGVLQVLDMDPNTSLRNLTLQPVGQTKYIDPVVNDEVVLMQPGGGGTPIIFRRATNGLAGWFATNVNDGTGAAASGTITATGFPAAPGDTFTVDGQVYVGAAAPRTSGGNDWDTSLGSVTLLAAEIAAAINDPANGTPAGTVVGLVTAVPVAGVVTVTANADGTAGNAIALAEASVNLVAVAMAGGADADALSAAVANANADDVLTLLGFGSLTGAAGTLTLGDINGALTGGAITAAQLTEVLDILAGRQYEVPNNQQIDSDGSTFDVQPPVGSDGGPGFVAGTLRPLFLNDGLPLSFTQGELVGFTDSGFVYGGVAGTNGEAVVVYNDDGTFFTP